MKKPKIKGRPIPTTNEIVAFFHCMNCLNDKPNQIAPAEWACIECGWTPLGFQVRCYRCNLNIVHVDFEGIIHPANLGGGRKKPTQ